MAALNHYDGKRTGVSNKQVPQPCLTDNKPTPTLHKLYLATSTIRKIIIRSSRIQPDKNHNMSDNIDRDTKDLDALLREDASPTNPGLSPEPLALNGRAHPTSQTHLQRLLARSTHIGNSLRQAFTSIRDTQDLVDADRTACAQLTAELENWEEAIINLDSAFNILINKDIKDNISTENETAEPHASLTAKIAAQAARIRELESQIVSLGGSIEKQPARPPETTEDAITAAANPAADQILNRLIIATTDHGNLKFPLHKEIITIGRSPQNDIHIRSRFISRYHARIVCDEDGATIEDLGSSNGITVNSQSAKRQPLRSGDLIDLGRTQLKYIDLSEGSSGEGQA
jgi:pSer/pThr/pTyr-binding forkhead associated (FHA) protein